MIRATEVYRDFVEATISDYNSHTSQWARDIYEDKSGTTDDIQRSNETMLPFRPRTSKFTLFRDGGFVKPPQSMTLRAWRALPTSAGKTFEWEGIVSALLDNKFEARLMNVKGASQNFSECAEFELQDVPLGDRDLVQLGAVFRWVIGQESRSGTRQKYSKIVFRRLPAWTQRSLAKAEKQLGLTMNAISWVEDEPTGER
jgi:hypothetical protein